MQVTCEAVLDSCANEAVGPREHFYLNQNEMITLYNKVPLLNFG